MNTNLLLAGILAVSPGVLAQDEPEEETKSLSSYSVGGKRDALNGKIEIERPDLSESIQLDRPKPTLSGIKLDRPVPQLEVMVMPEPGEPASGETGSGPAAESGNAAPAKRTDAAQTAAPAGGATTNIVPLKMDPPQYPAAAARRRIEGNVTVEFTVNAQGETEDIKVVSSNPPRTFDREAIRAVGGWKFKPAMKNGRPVPQRLRNTLNFSLSGS